jgi:membrane protein
MSWLIVLFGAEIAFAHQNVDTCEFEHDCRQVKPAYKRMISLFMLHLCVRRFMNAEQPFCKEELSDEIGAPIRLVGELVEALVNARLLSVVSENDGEELRYQPARDINSMTIHCVLHALDHSGKDDIPVHHHDVLDILRHRLSGLDAVFTGSSENILLKDLKPPGDNKVLAGHPS